MAVQFQVAFSKQVRGAGIIAARGEIDAELAVLRSRLEGYEAELREDEAIERMQGLLAELPQLLASVGAKGKRGGR